jgi:hypothetical protein
MRFALRPNVRIRTGPIRISSIDRSKHEVSYDGLIVCEPFLSPWWFRLDLDFASRDSDCQISRLSESGFRTFVSLESIRIRSLIEAKHCFDARDNLSDLTQLRNAASKIVGGFRV